MKFKRSSGVILHPSSLPGPYGIGDIGPEAFRWVEFLVEANSSLWQVLPLGPTGFGDSPYQCFSAFAGNPYLIDLDELVDAGLLRPEALAPLAALRPDRVDYGALYRLVWPLLTQAYENFRAGRGGAPYRDFAAFLEAQA